MQITMPPSDRAVLTTVNRMCRVVSVKRVGFRCRDHQEPVLPLVRGAQSRGGRFSLQDLAETGPGWTPGPNTVQMYPDLI